MATTGTGNLTGSCGRQNVTLQNVTPSRDMFTRIHTRYLLMQCVPIEVIQVQYLAAFQSARTPSTKVHQMTYPQSVLDAADEFGYLTDAAAKRLLRDHNVSAFDAWIDLGDSAADAAALLEYLGY